MKTLVEKLNLAELTIAYGMSPFFFLTHLARSEHTHSRNKVRCSSQDDRLPRSNIASPVSFQTTPTDPFIKRVETVGKIHPHVKAKIISTDRCASSMTFCFIFNV